MRVLSPEATRGIFLTLVPSVLAVTLNSNPSCCKRLNKSTITAATLDTELKRHRAYAKLRDILQRDNDLAEALERAWLDQHQSTISAIEALKADEPSLRDFLSTQPTTVKDLLVALSLIGPEAVEETESPAKPNPQFPNNSEVEPSERIVVAALKKELKALRRQMKTEQEKASRKEANLQRELATARTRLAQARQGQSKAEQTLALTNQHLESSKAQASALQHHLVEKESKVSELHTRTTQLQLDLSETKSALQKALASAEEAMRAEERARSELQHIRSQPPVSQNLLSLLLAAPTQPEVAELDYSLAKAQRSVTRALSHATETEPSELALVWSQWLREEENLITLIADQGAPSHAAVREQLPRLWELASQLNLRITLIQRLALMTNRLSLYYEEEGGE